MADLAQDPSPLQQLLEEAKVPAVLATIVTEAFEDHEDFAFAFPTMGALDPWLSKMDGARLHLMGGFDEHSILHSQPAARLRIALHRAHATSGALEPTKGVELSKGPPASPQQSAWLEHVPPKLTQERIDELIDQFKKNYPGEILTSDTTPSVRLLSLVHEGLKTRLGWIPWQYRLSAKQYQEIHEAKAHKPLRSEMQILAHALVDDTPELNLENKPLSAGWFLRCQTERFSGTPSPCAMRLTWQTSSSSTTGWPSMPWPRLPWASAR